MIKTWVWSYKKYTSEVEQWFEPFGLETKEKHLHSAIQSSCYFNASDGKTGLVPNNMIFEKVGYPGVFSH